MRYIILVACIKCKRYPIKTVGQDAFCSYYISYNYFKNSPKITQSFKKSTSRVANLVLNTCVNLKAFYPKLSEEIGFEK